MPFTHVPVSAPATGRPGQGPGPRDPPDSRAAAGLVAVLQPRRRPRPALGPGPDPAATGGDGAGLGAAARRPHGVGAAGPPGQLTDSARIVGRAAPSHPWRRAA